MLPPWGMRHHYFVRAGSHLTDIAARDVAEDVDAAAIGAEAADEAAAVATLETTTTTATTTTPVEVRTQLAVLLRDQQRANLARLRVTLGIELPTILPDGFGNS